MRSRNYTYSKVFDRYGADVSLSAAMTAILRLLAFAVLATSVAAQTKRLPQPGVRYVPSPQYIVDAMLELAHVTSADVVYDLGSGDGRIPITAAQRFGARGVGIEIEPRLIRESNDNAAKAKVSGRVWFLNQDLFEADISAATVVTLFLHPRLNQELIPKLKRELRPGTRIVSYLFDMGPDWPPEESQDVGLMIYRWTIR